MAVKNIVLPITLTSIDSATVTGSYQAINSSGLPKACFLLRITNASNKDVTVSFDGSTDQEYVVAGTSLPLNFQTNAQPNTNIANMAQGTKVYVKGAAGTGSIFLSGYYQPQAN